jgi:hypothetical protein
MAVVGTIKEYASTRIQSATHLNADVFYVYFVYSVVNIEDEAKH